MVLHVSVRDLLKTMKAVCSVIQPKAPLPILGDVLFTQKDGVFMLTASSPEHSLTMPVGITIEAGNAFCEFCLDPKTVIPFLQSLPEQPLTMEVDLQTKVAKLTHNSGHVTVPTDNAAEYPRIVFNGEPTSQYTIDTKIFLPAIAAALPNTADDALRPVMNTVCLDINAEGITFVATDGQTLYKYMWYVGAGFLSQPRGEAQSGFSEQTLIPKEVVRAIAVPFANSEQITVTRNVNHVALSSGDICFTIRHMEGRYPKYNAVIPQNQPYHILLPVRQLANALNRVSLMSDSGSQLVILEKTDLFMNISSKDMQFNRSGSEELVLATDDQGTPLPDACTLPSGFKIGFKASGMLKLLDNISTDNVRLELSEPSRALLLKEDAPNSTLTELLMPMTIQ